MPWKPDKPSEVPSIGWDLLDWFMDSLPSPADPAQPLIFTDEQARLVLRWYAVDPDSEQFVYRRGCLEMAKGWGKSPFAAALSIAELAGPVCFAGWDADGRPVGQPWGLGEAPPPWVQIAAVSEDQTDNTYAALYEMLTANDGRAADALGIDQGRTRLYLRNRPGRLEPVTAAAGSREGQRVTFALLDETHLWTPSNHGVKLARTLRRNAAKMGGRTFETTNAPALGEKSVAEHTGNDSENGEPGILFYARRPVVEPDPEWTDEQLVAALDEAYGDSYWYDRNRGVAEIRDPASIWSDVLRFWFNIRVPEAGKAVDPRRWDELKKPQEVPAGAYIGLGFQGSDVSHAVLRGCTREGYSWTVAAWERPAGERDWTVPRAAVSEAVAAAFDTYDVGLMFADPPHWRTEIEAWAGLYGEDRVLALDTLSPARFAPAVDRWLTAIREGTHTHDGDAMTDMHVRAAHLRKVRLKDEDEDGRTRYVIVPGESGRRIGAAVADVLAHEAGMSMPEPPERSPMVVWA